MSEQQKQADNRARATTDEFRAFVKEGWAPRRSQVTGPSPAAGHAAARRAVLSGAYPGQRLIIPAGGLKVRSNDTDYVFRPHSAFAWLTGLGADREPDAVLVLEPVSGDDATGHEAVLYFRPLADRDTDEFFADARYGEERAPDNAPLPVRRDQKRGKERTDRRPGIAADLKDRLREPVLPARRHAGDA